MQTELLPSFLHLYYNFGSRRSTFIQLLQSFDNNPQHIISSSPSDLRHAGLNTDAIKRIKKPDQRRISADLAWQAKPDHHLICFDDTRYPALLRQIPDCPAMLFLRGDINLLASPQIAIVGSRHCTPGGAQHAREFSTELAGMGLTITSGLANGIDSHAHQAALDCGGKTIAVFGTGIDCIYPAGNFKLAESIAEQGLLVSEFPLGSKALPAHFPQRNRIISGLSIATLVIEAAQRSGSLITARLAGEQGREVFALPGSIHNPQARGCHRLIRDGAKLVEQVEDITEELSSLIGFIKESRQDDLFDGPGSLDPEYQCLLEVIGYDPVTVDTILQRSRLTIDKLSSMLPLLELEDLIQSAPGGCYVRT